MDLEPWAEDSQETEMESHEEEVDSQETVAEDATAAEEEATEAEKSWTSDGKRPYIFWHVNSHGSMNDTKKTHKHEEKETDMDVRAYSIAGNQNQCGWAAILRKNIPVTNTESYECSGKAIDFCIPSVERIVWYDRKEKGDDTDIAYNAAIQKVKNLYFNTNTFERIQEKGGFEVMDKPTLYHEYQLYGNEGENTRPYSRKGLPKRATAGDIKISDKMIYGVWVVCTNIRILEPLALTSITDDYLGMLEENKGLGHNNLFLPPELMNPLNMASRRNGMPLGAAKWMKAIDDLKKNYFPSDQELRKLRVRARTALENMWRTQRTNLHDIIDIFAPFNETGKRLVKNFKSIKLYSIDVSCRSNIGKLNPPNPDIPAGFADLEDSITFYDGNRVIVEVPPQAKKRRNSSLSPSEPSSKPVSKRIKRNTKKPTQSKKGGTKRKYSRKRRTPPRTGIRFTRRRRRTRY